MFGTIVNFFAIIFGSFIGLLFKNGIQEKYKSTLMHGLSLCIIYIGVSGSMKCDNFILLIISFVIGALIGEYLDIDNKIKILGNKIENNFKRKGGKISEGFVTASLLFCVGSMAIVGSLESGLSGDNSILFAKSVLDGVVALIFTSSLGVGVLLSSMSVLLYQGLITIFAFLLKGILISSVIANITSVGSLLILGLGLNMLEVTKIKIANLLPAVLIPIIYQLILNMHF